MVMPFPWRQMAVILCFVIMLLFSGCSSTTPSLSGEDTESLDESGSQRVSLSGAISVLDDDDIGLGMWRERGYTIHNAIARNVDREGWASMWILSVNSREPFYFVYNRGSISTMQWTESSRDHAIEFSRIISPEELFLIQEDLIDNITGSGESTIDELELRNGIYYIRGNQPGDMWELAFDATTGKQIR